MYLNERYSVPPRYRLRPIADLLGHSAYQTFLEIFQEGMTVRQVRRALYKRGVEISDTVAEKLGNHLAAPAAVTHVAFHDSIWWHGRVDFGDSMSCFINHRERVITGLFNREARFVTWWRDDQPVGRSIIWRIAEVDAAYVGKGLYVFNTYSTAYNGHSEQASWSNRDAAYALAEVFGYAYVTRQLVTYEVTKNNEDFYINSDVAWALTPEPLYEDEAIWEVDLPQKSYFPAPVCIHCGNHLPQWGATCPTCGKTEPLGAALVLPTVSVMGQLLSFTNMDDMGQLFTDRGYIIRANPRTEQVVVSTDNDRRVVVGRDADGNWVATRDGYLVTELTPVFVPASRFLNADRDYLFAHGLQQGLVDHPSLAYIQDDGSIWVYFYEVSTILEQKFHVLDCVRPNLFRSRETQQLYVLHDKRFYYAMLLGDTYVPDYWVTRRYVRNYGHIYVPDGGCPLPVRQRFQEWAASQGLGL